MILACNVNDYTGRKFLSSQFDIYLFTFSLCDQAQAEDFGVEPRVLATMSQAELAMRAETDLSLGKAPKKAGAATGRGRKVIPTFANVVTPYLVEVPALLPLVVKQ